VRLKASSGPATGGFQLLVAFVPLNITGMYRRLRCRLRDSVNGVETPRPYKIRTFCASPNTRLVGLSALAGSKASGEIDAFSAALLRAF
jgi:hypothetical protein